MEAPDMISLWTADEVAECLEYEKYLSKEDSTALYSKLWKFLSEAQNPTPLGGDGSNGTVEYPCGRLSPNNDDKAPHWWHRLDANEREAITKAAEAKLPCKARIRRYPL